MYYIRKLILVCQVILARLLFFLGKGHIALGSLQMKGTGKLPSRNLNHAGCDNLLVCKYASSLHSCMLPTSIAMFEELFFI